VSEPDNHAESGQSVANSVRPRGLGRRWWSAVWLWPAVAIAGAGIAGTLFGPIGAALTGEALAVFVVAAGILILSDERWLTFALAAALTASLVAFAASIRLYEVRHKSSRPAPAATRPGAQPEPVEWPGRTISQVMVGEADLRGADLDGANLDGLQLSRKNLGGAQANGASFRGSELEYANLRGASLAGACLQGANLTGADLAGADFTGADVAGVTVSAQAKKTALAWPGKQATPTAACS
jgi:Pentapeptide repeats (8 copies)